MSVRGFADWRPSSEARYWIDRVQDTLDEYRDYLPISLRQIFYRLVAEHGFDKTEQAYNRLGNWVARARRAQMLPFGAIRDDQGRAHEVLDYANREAFWESVEKDAKNYMRDRMQGQPVRIEVWSEAGMTEQLTRVAWRYSIPVYSSRGFSSVTNTHALAQRAAKFDGPTMILHIGDHDPSGVSIYETLRDDSLTFMLQQVYWDLEALPGAKFTLDSLKDYRGTDGAKRWLDERRWTVSGPDIRAVRVAITMDQVEEYGFETAPPKRSDSRTVNWEGETAQAEAIPPNVLQEMLTDAIEAELDMDAYNEQLALEAEDEEKIKEAMPEPGAR